MRKIISLIVLSITFLSLSAQSKDIDAIKKINIDWLLSFTTKDTSKLKSIFADDVVYINGRGIVFNKKSILDNIMEPNREYQSVSLDKIIEARVIGNTGIIIAQTTTRRKRDHEESIFKASVMNVFEKRKGKWFVVASNNIVLDVR